MYSYDIADAWTSDELWAWYCAINAINEAIEILSEAGAALLPLIADSDWQAESVRSLHNLMQQVKDRSAADAGDLGVRVWELEAMSGS